MSIKRNELSLELATMYYDHGADYQGVAIIIDGIDLIDRLRPIEQPQASNDGTPTLAGHYNFLPTAIFLGDQLAGGRIRLLDCPCGAIGCWTFGATQRVTNQTIEWHDFQQVKRAGIWSYQTLAPLIFSRADFENEIERIRL